MSWVAIISAFLGVVEFCIDYAKKQSALQEADDVALQKQVVAIWTKIKLGEQMDKQIDDVSDADLDKLLDIYRDKTKGTE